MTSGFLGFGKCPGRTGEDVRGFTHRGHEIRSEHPVEEIEYTIDVIIRPGDENEKIPATGSTPNHKGGKNHV